MIATHWVYAAVGAFGECVYVCGCQYAYVNKTRYLHFPGSSTDSPFRGVNLLYYCFCFSEKTGNKLWQRGERRWWKEEKRCQAKGKKKRSKQEGKRYTKTEKRRFGRVRNPCGVCSRLCLQGGRSWMFHESLASVQLPNSHRKSFQ